jgi:hypothetical protein
LPFIVLKEKDYVDPATDFKLVPQECDPLTRMSPEELYLQS